MPGVSLRLSFATLLLVVVACAPDQPTDVTANIRVMTFNIEWGGTHVSFDKVVEAVRHSGADIVGIQEAEGNLQRIAGELGWHFDAQNYAISRFPILNPGDAAGRYVLIEVQPGNVVALLNVHLPSDPYGPDLVRDGATLDEVMAVEREIRLPKIRPYLDAARKLAAGNVPLFLTGDFNSPAHTDWTGKMVGKRPFLRYPVEWPVTRAVQEAGLRDSWRVAYPDVTTDPGLTWWAGRPPLELYAPGENDAEDRIDFLWFAGPAELLGSELIGEPGTPRARATVSPWPSDHRAVVSDFRVMPAEVPPLLGTVQRVYPETSDIEVVYRNIAASAIRVRKTGDAVLSSMEQPAPVSGSGQMQFEAGRFSPGHYTLTLEQPGDTELQSDFWVLAENAQPEAQVVGKVFETGEEIRVLWRNAPGHRNDYLAIVEEGAESTYDNAATWAYVNALPAGELTIDKATAEGEWPVPPGRYVVRLLKDDGYEVLAESEPFVVR